jgi:hypothetical protein
VGEKDDVDAGGDDGVEPGEEDGDAFLEGGVAFAVAEVFQAADAGIVGVGEEGVDGQGFEPIDGVDDEGGAGAGGGDFVKC